MKKYFYYLTLILLVSFVSCSDDDDQEIIYELAFDGVDNTNGLELLEGTSGEITIKSGNEGYAVVSSNKDVATASLEGNKITVDAYSIGSSVLTITDKHKSATITVTVSFNDALVVLPDSEPSPTILAQGFYVANEDWFGHDNGTVNYFKNDGSINYRVYRAANDAGEVLGTTTQFATIYGGNAYFVSKQGNRLVVADAKTLKKKASLTEINGDGRTFIGINPDKGYIATSDKITVFNIKDLKVEKTIEGISGEAGNMCLVGNYVFAVVKSKGLYVIDKTTDAVVKNITGSFESVVQSKDGTVWGGAGPKLIKIDPNTFETTEIALTGTQILGDAWAWNAGSFCASTQENVLYWTYSGKVNKYDIDKKELNTALYTLGKDDENKQLTFYGAGLRVDPITDKLILTVRRSGFGVSYSYNWVHIIDKNGNLEKNIVLRGDNGTGSGWAGAPTVNDNYYWFPAIPFFEDNNDPEILLNQVIVESNQRKAICLNDKIVDADNISAAIVKSISFDEAETLVNFELKQDSLIVTAKEKTGRTKLSIKANSNGKLVEKEIRVDVR